MLTGGASRSPEGAGKGFVFVPACFITSEAFLRSLGKGPASQAPLPSVLPDSGDPPIICHLSPTAAICLWWPAVDSRCVLLGEQLSLLLRHPDQPAHPKVLKVAVIGAPNAGKSTLSNQLLGRKVSKHFFFFLKGRHCPVSGCLIAIGYSPKGVCRVQESPHHPEPSPGCADGGGHTDSTTVSLLLSQMLFNS